MAKIHSKSRPEHIQNNTGFSKCNKKGVKPHVIVKSELVMTSLWSFFILQQSASVTTTEVRVQRRPPDSSRFLVPMCAQVGSHWCFIDQVSGQREQWARLK